MRDWNVSIFGIIRTTVGVGAVVILAWGATIGVNYVYGLGGRREVTQRLNPVLVQVYVPIPLDARPYLSFGSRHLSDEVVLVTQDRALKVESARGSNPKSFEHKFLTTLDRHCAYELFVERGVGRGFVTVLQNPDGGNGYTGKIRITDPYPGEGDYRFQVWHRKVR